MPFGFGESQTLDPSGFQMSVFVTNPTDSVRIPLWMKKTEGGSGLGSGVDDALSMVDDVLDLPGGSNSGSSMLQGLDLPIVESVSLELSLGLVAKTTINIAAPFELGIKLLESGLFKVGNMYEVQLGYPKLGRFTPWFTSMAQKPSIRISADEGLSGTLNGGGGGMASVRGVSSKVYEGMSYREIIEEIADRHKWKLLVGAKSEALDLVDAVFGITDREHPLEKKRAKISQKNLSDWFFIQHMARNSGCDAYLAPSVKEEKTYLYIKKRSDSLKDVPNYKFLMRGKSDFIKVFPMFEFEIEPVGVYLPGGAVKTSSQDLDPISKKVLAINVTPQTSDETILGDGGVPSSGDKDVEGVKLQAAATDGSQRTGEFLSISARDPRGAKDICQAHRDTLAFKGGINASFFSYGIPDLYPGEVVEIAGVGIFSSNYWTESLTHNASATEWIMNLKVINNGSAGGGLDQYLAEQLVDKINTEKTEEGVESGSGGSTIVNAVEG